MKVITSSQSGNFKMKRSYSVGLSMIKGSLHDDAPLKADQGYKYACVKKLPSPLPYAGKGTPQVTSDLFQRR